ncbi:outer membrane protein assembly factor BamE domain-containing protein [Kluyvera cryocrescens]|uniref:outer membrane protein assembly factor BamE domain-containing protein n=1 Tax=Kluyvera cryocrescens TaxID=580 RepID=UPI003D7FDB07
MHLKKLMMIGCVVALLAGCTTGEKIHNVQVGMTKQQVIDLLGTPDGDSVKGSTEQIQYSNRLASGWGWDKGDYYVTFENGKVTSYGSGEIRSAGAPVKGIVVF